MRDASVYVTPSKNQLEDQGMSEQELSLISRISPKMSPKSTPPTSRALDDDHNAPVMKEKTLKYNLAMAYAAGGSIEENRRKLKTLIDIFGVEIIVNMQVNGAFYSLHFLLNKQHTLSPFAFCFLLSFRSLISTGQKLEKK